MARVIRIAIEIFDFDPSGQRYAIHVSESIRTAKPRTLIALHAGSGIRDEDLELTAQVVDDAIRSAVGRTLGITQTLPF